MAPLTITMLFLAVFLLNISPVSAIVVPREKTLWGTGYHPHPTSFCPCIMDWGQGWDTYIMYEPMFGTDVATGELIKWLGEDITWINSTTIEVTLREGIHWTDGNPITSEDVQFSYYLYGGFDESPEGKYWHMGGFAARVGPMSNFEIVSNRTFRVHIKPEYADSSVVWRSITRSYLIVPKHVWTEIEEAYPDWIPTFANDWQEAATPEEWKVASGMYLPYWHDDVRTIMKRNEDWWGIDVFGKKPEPEYFGYITYDTNPPAALALEAGYLDWCGKYVPGMDKVMERHPNIHTYFKDPPYFPDKSAKLMVPNHRKYPLNEPWLHKAIAHVLDFEAFNVVSSGYLKPPSPLLIPADDTVARELLNTTIEAKYAITFDPDKALEILNEYCIKVDGTWYTKDGPSDEWLTLYGPDAELPEDALPDVSGINVPLGPWKLMDVYGWTDVNAIDVFAVDQIGSFLDISIETYFPDYGTYEAKMNDMDFDFVHYVMHWGLNGDMYERYAQMFTGPVGCYGHYGDYRNPELEDLLDSLDTVPAGSAEQQNIANQIQEIVGREMPMIPLAGHPDWYIYSDQYWTGWPNEYNPFLAASPYGGTSQVANLHTIILGLSTVAEVEFSNIDISKTFVEPGEETTISADVTNIGDMEGVTTVELLINEIIVDSQEVTLTPDETKTVSFTVSRDEIGTYQVDIGGLKGSFQVTIVPPVPAIIEGTVTDEETGEPISGATVTADGYIITTGTDGTYSLEVETGTYTVSVVKEGYKTKSTTVAATEEGETYTADLAMTSVPVEAVIPLWVYALIAVFVIIAVVSAAYAIVSRRK